MSTGGITFGGDILDEVLVLSELRVIKPGKLDVRELTCIGSVL